MVSFFPFGAGLLCVFSILAQLRVSTLAQLRVSSQSTRPSYNLDHHELCRRCDLILYCISCATQRVSGRLSQ